MMPLFLLEPLTTLSLPALVAFNEFGQIVCLLRHANEFVLQQFTRSWTLMEALLAWERTARVPAQRTSLGSRWRQQDTNSRKALENGPSRVGGGFFRIKKSTCARYVHERHGGHAWFEGIVPS